MDMTGEHHIPAPRGAVWEALNDPEILKKCIPGCESLTPTDGGYDAAAVIKVGPVKARFQGTVTLSNVVAGESYTISGEGKGGAAGFAQGGADVRLADGPDGGTVLSYTVRATVGGRLAQLGGRLIEATSKKLAAAFFTAFAAAVAPADGADTAGDGAGPATTEKERGLRPLLWVGGVIVVAAVLVAVFWG